MKRIIQVFLVKLKIQELENDVFQSHKIKPFDEKILLLMN